MRKTRAALLVAVGAGLWGASAACSAVLGITEFSPGDAGIDASSGADGAPSRTCADQDGGAGLAGCACSAATPTGCNGSAQSERLLCNNGIWTTGPACAAGSNCDTRAGNTQGTCAAIDTSCAAASPGQQICVGSNVVQCGPDLVSETPVMACVNQACVNGACEGVCTPGGTQCSGNAVQTCGADGTWGTTSSCSESCGNGRCTTFPSCQGGGPGATTDCGGSGGGGDDAGTDAGGTSDCCASSEVPGGTYYRSFDNGVSAGGMVNPATVSNFRLDDYEITVGRFRSFVSAVVSGWLPAPGSGKHTHLNGGSGLAAVGTDAAASSESGWSMAWNANLATSQGSWDQNLACDGDASWTNTPMTSEHRPISCLTWYEAYAFCIWDGGFLPSEAEWNYAAAGGSDQRAYPWSTTAAPTAIDCTYANYDPGTACSPTGLDDVGSQSPLGDGRWGQSDLAGNAWEWALDSFATYQVPCNDCANVAALPARVARGGAFNLVATALYAGYRSSYTPATRDGSVGARCARIP
jgi:sulfatase modifying factor 1